MATTANSKEWIPSLDAMAQTTVASWIIRDKATGDVIAETFSRRTVNALNTERYEAVPIQQYLASLNAK